MSKCCNSNLNKRTHKIYFYEFTDKAKTGAMVNSLRVPTEIFFEWADIQTKKGEVVFENNNSVITVKTHLFIVPWNSNTKTITNLNGILYRDTKYKIDSIEDKNLSKDLIYIYAHAQKNW